METITGIGCTYTAFFGHARYNRVYYAPSLSNGKERLFMTQLRLLGYPLLLHGPSLLISYHAFTTIYVESGSGKSMVLGIHHRSTYALFF